MEKKSTFNDDEQNWISSLDIISDSNDPKKCFNCQEIFDCNEIISLACDCDAVCSLCISNIFEINISQMRPEIFVCNCGSPIPYTLFKDHILFESLQKFLSKLSESSKLPSNYNCGCGQSLKKFSTLSITCPSCQITVCNKCFAEHENNISCLNFLNQQYICSVCQTNEKIAISCGCKICQNCFFSEIKEQILDNPLNDPNCKICDTKVILEEIYDWFGGKYNFVRFREDALLAARFNCNICNNDKLVDGSITLYCGHRYCKKCISTYIISALDSLSFNSTEIQCPECDQSINYQIISNILKGPALDRYQNLLVRNVKSKNLIEVLKFCNTCDYGAYLDINETKFDCPECKKSICPKCNKNLTNNCCQVASPNLKLSLLGSLKNALVKCPNCFEAIIKAGGCNFIKCSWPKCENIYFCFLCRKVLTLSQHYSHYKLKGPFGGSCNTLDNIVDIKFKDKNEYRAIDFDALFTTFCIIVIVVILEYSPTGQCSGPFRLWFCLKALSLLIRLGIKAGFYTYLQQRWAKAALALIKLFSIGWITYGIVLIALEENCDTSNNLYLGLLGFVIFFVMGSVALLIVFIVALCALKKSEKEDEESELKERLYIK